jgi:DDE superfamily endonuclease
MSDSGYSNNQIQMAWARHFNKHTKARTKGAKRLLLCDGYNSHLEYEFVEYCWQEGIIPFAFIPHTTHLAQPLDVKVFQSLKHYHNEAIDEQRTAISLRSSSSHPSKPSTNKPSKNLLFYLHFERQE